MTLKSFGNIKSFFTSFTWRDLKVRYKQTFVGAGWAIFNRLSRCSYSRFFQQTWEHFIRRRSISDIRIHRTLVLAFFSSALNDTSNCLIANQSIVTKVYFPRLILPLSSVLTKLVDFGISALILILLMVYYGFVPRLESIFVIPIVLAISFMASVGLGLTLAAVNVKYRDVRYALPFSFKCFSLSPPSSIPRYCRKIFVAACSESNDGSNSKRPRFPSRHNTDKLGAYRISFAACAVLLIIGVYVFKKD